MKRPASLNQATHQLTRLVGRRLNGSRASLVLHNRRMQIIVETIYRQKQRGPYQITWTDLRSLLDRSLVKDGHEPTTALFTSVYQFACLRDNVEDWLPHLYGPWAKPAKKGALPACLLNERTPTPLCK